MTKHGQGIESKKLYVHGLVGNAAIRFVCQDGPVDYGREAREIAEWLERFLPRETFEKILELMA